MSDTLDAALAWHRAGRFADAESGYRHALAAGEAMAAQPLAVLMLQTERFAEAAELLAPLVAAAPQDPDLAVNLSLALRRRGDNEAAVLHAQRATELAPARVSSWNALGLAAFALQRYEDALAAIEHGLRLAPGHAALRLHRAQCLRRLHRQRDALQAYTQLVHDQPGSLEAWRGLADTRAGLGDPGAALQARARASTLAPDDTDVAFEHAITLLQAGRAADAATRFEALLRRNPDDAQLQVWLGRARLKLGDATAARDAFARAHAQAPDDPVIAHFHAASSGTLPADVERDYIRNLFDDFADRFEHTLVDRLAYATPTQLASLLREHGADGDGARDILDLGCGTGLMALAMQRPGRSIDGVDLSPRMLDHAREKGLYRDLHAAEGLEFLRNTTKQWHGIVAADVFVYVALLAPVFEAAFARLAAGGWFAFSIERSTSADTELPADTGRYRHAAEQVGDALEAAGFVAIIRSRVVLRRESDRPVDGELFLAWRGGSTSVD